LLDNPVAVADDERDELRRNFEQKSCESVVKSESGISACNDLASHRAQMDMLARKRALGLEAVEKKEEVTYCTGSCYLIFVRYIILEMKISRQLIALLLTTRIVVVVFVSVEAKVVLRRTRPQMGP